MIAWKARPRRLAALALPAALLLVACGGPPDPAEERVRRARRGTGDLVIAAPWPWSLRTEIRYGQGLEMAVDEINAAGGVAGRRLRLAKYDDHETIDDGLRVAQKISADPDVVAVVGHLQSYITVQAAGVYSRAGLLLVAPTATDPQLTRLGLKRVFRATFTDGSIGRQLADFAAARGWKRVAICYIRNDYGRNLANAFEARATQTGITVHARSSYDPSEQVSERTFEPVVHEWKAAEIDAILLAGEVPSAAIFVAQTRRKGIKVPILGGDAMSSPGLMAVAGPAAEGMVVASFFHPDEPRAEVARFDEAFKNRFGVPPDAGSALGYDCVRLLTAGMRKAGSAVPDEVAAALHALDGWRGVTGVFAFDENGDLPEKPILMSVVRGGRFEYLAPTDPARAASTGAPAGAPGR
jgi:branched-chain amino acid transport system substrate-binding protein